VDTNTKFAASLDLDYPVLSDPDGRVAAAYGLLRGKRKIPARKTFIIGEDGTILHVFEKVKPGSHGKDVAEKLEELGVAKRS